MGSNPALSANAGVPEWTKGTACKAVIHGFKSRLRLNGSVAQLEERSSEKREVGGSIPPRATALVFRANERGWRSR